MSGKDNQGADAGCTDGRKVSRPSGGSGSQVPRAVTGPRGRCEQYSPKLPADNVSLRVLHNGGDPHLRRGRAARYKQSSDKPGSVITSPKGGELHHLSRPAVTDGLNLPTRAARRSPEPTTARRQRHCMVFQPTGFTHIPHYCGTSCALTARFHPYPDGVRTV